MKTGLKNSISTISIIFFLIHSGIAQQPDRMLIPFERDGLWGYMNEEKEVIAQAIYEEAYPTSNQRGRVKHNDKYGFVDTQGKLVIKCKYEEAADFVHGVARVKRKGKEFFIKTNGKKNKVTIGVCGNHDGCFYPDYRTEWMYKEESGKYGIITKTAKTGLRDTFPVQFDRIIPVTHRLMLVEQNGKLSFLNKSDFRGGTENVLRKLDFIYEDYQLFNCFWCASGIHRFLGIKQNGLWGVMDIRLGPKVIVAPKYYSVSSLAKGYGLVEYAKGKFGYIDQKGNEYFFRN